MVKQEEVGTTATQQPVVKKEVVRGKITLRRIFENTWQKPGTLTAEIEQEVTTFSTYPAKKISSDKQSALFDVEDFGFEAPKPYESVETRIAWVFVPLDSTEESVKAKLEAAEARGAVIYKVLSSQPILDENQLYAIKNGLGNSSKASFANTQVCKYPMGHADEGKLILDSHGNPMYRRTFFWHEAHADEDFRSVDDVYMSPEIKAELLGASAIKGQTI